MKQMLIWLVGSFIVVLEALTFLPVVHLDGQYIPLDNDSFYHARRIVDTVHDPSAFYQFDSRIHAPQGSWLTWPWGFDYLVARTTRAVMSVTGTNDPMKVIAFWPVAWSVVNIGLMLALATVLGLSTPLRFAAVLCAACSPLTVFLHAVGRIDHHFMEYTLVLATLLSGLLWLQQPGRQGAAAAMGTVLGLAPTVHAGLFILQLPLLITYLLAWLRKIPLQEKSTCTFALFLLSFTLLGLAPSGPFQAWQFHYYTLSWFQLYIACATSLILLLLILLPRKAASSILLAFLVALILVPVWQESQAASKALTGDIAFWHNISEARSIWGIIKEQGVAQLFGYYSLLILLLPAVLYSAGATLFRCDSLKRVYWATWVLFGGLFSTLQFRLHYFGSFVLYLPLLFGWQKMITRLPDKKTQLLAVLAILLLVAYLPSAKTVFPMKIPPGNNRSYAVSLPLFSALANVCKEAPGIVLAPPNLGHMITYHTDCAVLADNFILTPLHVAKERQAMALLQGSARLLANTSTQPAINYIFVVLDHLYRQQKDGGLRLASRQYLTRHNPRLTVELLLGTEPRPKNLVLIDELRLTDDHISFPYAALYKVERP